MLTAIFDDELRRTARVRLQGLAVRSDPDDGLRHAAVAITLVGDDAGRPCVLLTRRSARLSAHGGQWALPGGRVDAGEAAEDAALRELHEELGLELPSDAVLGRLDDYPTRSGYRISPWVVWGGENPTLEPDPAEVASVYEIQLAEIDDHPPVFVSIPESDRPVIRQPLRGSFLHAPTAAVIYQFREVVLRNRHTRVAHLEQPTFAWRQSASHLFAEQQIIAVAQAADTRWLRDLELQLLDER